MTTTSAKTIKPGQIQELVEEYLKISLHLGQAQVLLETDVTLSVWGLVKDHEEIGNDCFGFGKFNLKCLGAGLNQERLRCFCKLPFLGFG